MTAGMPLSGVVVVALEHSVAGPLCSRILGDLGATIVKVERPAAATSRGTGTITSPARAPSSGG